MHLVGILFPHINDDARSKSHQTAKGLNKPLNFTHGCCEMNVDKLYLGAIQLKDPIKNIPNHDEDLHLANHKVENVQKLIEEQEQKVAHTSGKNMSLLSMFGTVIFVVFLPFV